MRKLVGNSAKWVSRMRNSWDSILVENPGRVQPDRFGPPERESKNFPTMYHYLLFTYDL